MKIECSFNQEHRSLTLIPEDELETAVLRDICTRTDKGQHIKITKINHQTQDQPSDFRVEFKVNGK